MSVVNSSTIGVNLGNSDGATALFGLGQTVLGSDGRQTFFFSTGFLFAQIIAGVPITHSQLAYHSENSRASSQS